MAGGWLEPRTRIPFVGIIAITVIVAIVALFLRSYVVDVFPGNDIMVQGAVVHEDTNLRGSATFQGERQFDLQYKERLAGMLSRSSGTLGFIVDVPARMLTVTGRTDVVLHPTEDGTGLAATFELDGRQADVAVYPGRRLLRFNDGLALDVALSDTISYEGSFMYNGDNRGFRYVPAESAAHIGADTVPLEAADGILEGEWREGTVHRVTVDTSHQVATVDNLW